MTRTDFSHVTFISAGAGSGKTYRLTEELERALIAGMQPSGVIGTTFTVKAAGELQDRVRERLIRSGAPRLAEQMSQALIGTVHSVCERLLKRFAFELGLSPALNVLGVEDQRLFYQALDEMTGLDRVREMNALAARLSIERWQDDVKRVADRARDNDIAAAQLTAMGAESADSLLAFFPLPVDADHKGALLRAVDAARRTIDVTTDTTKGTAGYLEALQSARFLLQHEDCGWSLWFALSKAKATKKSDAQAAAVRAAAQRYEQHADFHRDIRRYIERCYTIAAATLERFQALKTQRGLIDFSDMERLTLHALDNVDVAARLEDELELLLVDEFQDTNPMQLALFVKLAQFARRVIFVGDVKQAIYAFRGCDPDLVFETLLGLTQRDARTDILESSWRARPSLLRYLNQIFAGAFAKDAITAEQIVLQPQRSDVLQTPAIAQWRATALQAEQYEAFARGIAKLVADAMPIVDPDTGDPRPVRFGDIALLARTNKHVEQLARTLKTARVPMKMSLEGLLAVPEVHFAKACLRRLSDPADTLASAEIVAFADGGEPERWLADRLRYLADGGGSAEWLDASNPIVKRLAQLREDAAYQSPVETVARVLNDIGIREITAAWGPDAIKAAQRQRNLDAFLNLAVQYEAYCASQHEAATLTGFLFWVQHPHSSELDLQPTVTTGDAVHVLTYHKAKGLEWPVVIAADFDASSRSGLWDVRVNLTAKFDVAAPLAHRSIRFWPKVFADHSKDIPIFDRIMESAEARACDRAGASESRRLAYVGMTRARDALIVALPLKALKADAWLNTFASEAQLPLGDSLKLDDGNVIASGYTVLADGAAAPEPLPFAPVWFARRERVEERLRESVSPSRAQPVAATIAEVVDLGARIAVRGDDMALIGSALHRVIAAELVNPDRADAVERAAAMLAAFGAQAFVDADAAVACARRFRAFVMLQLKPLRVLAEYPLAHVQLNGQVARGWIDVLVETADGWTVIDHKSSPRPKREWAEEALGHSGQIACYRAMLAANGVQLAPSAWIHFPVGGGMIRVDTP